MFVRWVGNKDSNNLVFLYHPNIQNPTLSSRMKIIRISAVGICIILLAVGLISITDAAFDPFNEFRVKPREQDAWVEIRDTWTYVNRKPIATGLVEKIIDHGAVRMAAVRIEGGGLYVGKNLSPNLARGDTARVFTGHVALYIPPGPGKNQRPVAQMELFIIKY